MMLWPLPALVAWALAWGLFVALRASTSPLWMALLLASALGAVLSVLGTTRWRRVFIALGFPVSLLASGLAASAPAWVWLFPLLALLAVYPVNAWRDAPVFPTPRGALQGLARLAPVGGTAPRIVDAGCGLGDGLRELHAEYPHARLDGLEWSWPLRWLCSLRCRWQKVPAEVRRADIWAADWSPYTMVYLFQRPESMPRAMDKAARELAAGAWVASLEFEAAGWRPAASHTCPDGRPVWLYRVPFVRQG
jgi:hypothetical protein